MSNTELKVLFEQIKSVILNAKEDVLNWIDSKEEIKFENWELKEIQQIARNSIMKEKRLEIEQVATIVEIGMETSFNTAKSILNSENSSIQALVKNSGGPKLEMTALYSSYFDNVI
jgi:hypothetical protein